MKNLFYWMIMLCLVISLVGCAKGTSINKADPTVPVTAEITTTPEFESKGDHSTVIDTEYYTITIPESWCEDCIYEIIDGDNNDYSLCFCDKSNYEESGGWLFSVVLLSQQDDYTYYPSYEILGSIDVPGTGSFNVIVSYPTDVQFSNETAEKYCEMFDEIPDILKTISFKESCTFSETPVEVQAVMEQP